jgi:hypothetical protein
VTYKLIKQKFTFGVGAITTCALVLMEFLDYFASGLGHYAVLMMGAAVGEGFFLWVLHLINTSDDGPHGTGTGSAQSGRGRAPQKKRDPRTHNGTMRRRLWQAA